MPAVAVRNGRFQLESEMPLGRMLAYFTRKQPNLFDSACSLETEQVKKLTSFSAVRNFLQSVCSKSFLVELPWRRRGYIAKKNKNRTV